MLRSSARVARREDGDVYILTAFLDGSTRKYCQFIGNFLDLFYSIAMI